MRSLAKQKQEPHLRLAEALRARRKALRLNQTEAAALAGCNRLFVSEVESGKQTVRLDKLLDLLDALGFQLSLENGRNRLEIHE